MMHTNSTHDTRLSKGDRRWRALAAALLAATIAALGLSPATAAHAEASVKPTIVLVHGAFASPAGRAEVVGGLTKDRYSTVTPALGLAGLDSDVAIVRAALDAIPGEKILVGHSYGGFVVSNAATGRSDVRGLVYTAAYVPDAGETISTLGEGYVPPAFIVPPFPPGHLLLDANFFAIIDPAHFRADFAQDLNPKLAAALAADQGPTSLSILFAPSGPAAWHTLPSWYAVSGADRIIDPVSQRDMAARAGSTVVSFDDASHAGGYTHYASRLVKLIEQAAEATG